MKLLTLLILLTLIGCASSTKITKDIAVEACSHSKIHHDMMMLGLTDNALEPTSVHLHCNCPYGFPYNDEKMRCKTKAEIEGN